MGFPCKSQQITEKYHNNYSHMECRRRFYFNFWIAEQSNLLWVVLGDYLSIYLSFHFTMYPKTLVLLFCFWKTVFNSYNMLYLLYFGNTNIIRATSKNRYPYGLNRVKSAYVEAGFICSLLLYDEVYFLNDTSLQLT